MHEKESVPPTGSPANADPNAASSESQEESIAPQEKDQSATPPHGDPVLHASQDAEEHDADKEGPPSPS